MQGNDVYIHLSLWNGLPISIVSLFYIKEHLFIPFSLYLLSQSSPADGTIYQLHRFFSLFLNIVKFCSLFVHFREGHSGQGG